MNVYKPKGNKKIPRKIPNLISGVQKLQNVVTTKLSIEINETYPLKNVSEVFINGIRFIRDREN